MSPLTTDKELIDFCVDVQKRESNCLGFVPRNTYAQAWARDRLIMATENDELCGFIFFGRTQRPMHDSISIFQCAVVEDARRIQHGATLVRAVAEHRAAADRRFFKLRCRADLAANQFWRTLGFVHTHSMTESGARGWRVNVYISDIHPTGLLFPAQARNWHLSESTKRG
jgi:ribosomal protein S18 acetylase RimI-like enzyme